MVLLFDSADVGESSQTDTSAFIEQQRQLLDEMKPGARLSLSRNSDEDAGMRDKDRKGQGDFQGDHLKKTPFPAVLLETTDQSQSALVFPGLSNINEICIIF